MGSEQPLDLSATRATAMRVAQHLLTKGSKAEALEILTVWASIKNDADGHKLLAEALRHGSENPLAKAAFACMEGIESADQKALEIARGKWTAEALLRVEAESKKTFTGWQAELGYNNNVKYRNQVFHIQTEDSGVKRPHVITHLFADGGRILKSTKRTYGHLIGTENLSDHVRELMKAQHKEMFIALRGGKFDSIIDGKAPGGMDVIDTPPLVDPRPGRSAAEKKIASSLPPPPAAAVVPPAELALPPEPLAAPPAEPAPLVPVVSAAPVASPAPVSIPLRPATSPAVPVPAPAAPAVPAVSLPKPSNFLASPVRARLHVIRALGEGAPLLYELRDDTNILGRDGDVAVQDPFVSGRHTFLTFRNGKLYVEETSAPNGTFLRLRGPVELEFGDTFLAGDQLFRVERIPAPNDGPDESPTYFYSSPKWPTSFRIVQLWEGTRPGACTIARTNAVQIGRMGCDMNFPHDFWLSDMHCIVEDQGGFLMLTDFGSRAGTFTRVKTPVRLITGDEIVVGRTRLRVEMALHRRTVASLWRFLPRLGILVPARFKGFIRSDGSGWCWRIPTNALGPPGFRKAAGRAQSARFGVVFVAARGQKTDRSQGKNRKKPRERAASHHWMRSSIAPLFGQVKRPTIGT